MKWIGQHIWDLISRFRNDVYLEDVSSGTIASGGNLGLDSNNKIVKANVPAEHDAVTLTGTPDYITLSGQEITRNQIDLTADVTGTLPVGNTAAKVTSVIAGNGIDVDSTTGDVTVTAETASATNPGVVELATTAETTTGTDATRAVTPDGLKDGFQGSANIVAVGTITSGAWRGIAIDQTYLVGQSGTNTGDQTSVSGNAGTATALATARDINGVSFDGTGDITVTAAGSTLSDTVTVAKGGTGATTLASNSILTGNGTSAVQAESTLSYNSEILDIGADDDGAATIRRLRHTDEAGGDLYIRGGDATGTNKAGGALQLFGGRATGNSDGGAVIIQAGEINASSGSDLRGTNVIASFRADGDTLLQGNLIFEGSVPDAHETTFSITNPTADRTITVPDEDVDLAEVNHHFDYLHINLSMSAASANQYMGYGGHYNFNIGATAYTDGGGVVNKNSSKWSHYQAITACSIHTVMYNFTDTGGGSGDDYFFELWEIVPGSGESNNTTNLLKQYSITGNASANYLHTATDTTGYALAAGSQLLPVIRKDAAWSGTIFGEITIKFKY